MRHNTTLDYIKYNERRLTVKVEIDVVLNVGSRSKIDELNFRLVMARHGDQKIFIFDVSMNNASAVASQNGVQHLFGKISGQRLFQEAMIVDEVKQIFGAQGSLQDQYEGIWHLVEIQQTNHPWNIGDFSQQANFQRNDFLFFL